MWKSFAPSTLNIIQPKTKRIGYTNEDKLLPSKCYHYLDHAFLIHASAHHLNNLNIWIKFNKKKSKGTEDMEQTLWLKLLKYDIDIQSACLTSAFCSLSHWPTHFRQKSSSKGYRGYRMDTKMIQKDLPTDEYRDGWIDKWDSYISIPLGKGGLNM